MSTIRKYFKSRFEDGVLIEFDFSQLEVVVLAFLCQDKQLIHDIENGVDIHRVMASKLFDVPEADVTDAQRKYAKVLTFQLQYGSGPLNMSNETGLAIETCKRFISEYYKRYPKIAEWQNANIDFVNHTKETHVDKKTPKGYPVEQGTLIGPTGRRYIFSTKDAPAWMAGKSTTFSPTEIKNYPVQGMATGDIVPMILGKVYRELKKHPEYNDNIFMVNTIHDSIVFDVDSTYVRKCIELVLPIMNNVPKYLKQHFGIDFNVPIKADYKIGNNWLDMHAEDDF